MSGLSFTFTDEQEQFRQTVSRFARERLAPGYRDRSNSKSYPMNLHAEMAALGVLGIGLPERFGGTGAEDPVTLGIACDEIGAADVNLAAAPVTIGLTGAQLARGGTQAVQERWLPGLIDGTEIVAFGLTEPDAGSDAAAIRTTAVPAAGGWRITGEKNSVSHILASAATLVYARRAGCARSAGVSAFVVEANRPGVTVASFTEMGQLPIGRGTLHLDDVFVPRENLGGVEGRAFATVMSHFGYSRAAIGLQCLGATRSSLTETYYLRQGMSRIRQADRRIPGRFAAPRRTCDPGRGSALALLPHAVATAGWTAATAEAAMCKWWAPVVAKNAIEACLLTHGHYGWSDELPFQQRFRDIIGYQSGDGAAQIQKQSHRKPPHRPRNPRPLRYQLQQPRIPRVATNVWSRRQSHVVGQCLASGDRR